MTGAGFVVGGSAHDGGVQGRVKIFCSRMRIDHHAITATVRVIRRMQRLMDVADKVDEERQTAGSTPSVVVPLFKASRVFVDFARATRRFPFSSPRRTVEFFKSASPSAVVRVPIPTEQGRNLVPSCAVRLVHRRWMTSFSAP